MSEDRVQEALAAYLEQMEVGGPEPDVSHMTAAERDRLHSLIGLLDQTQGVSFGRGLEEERAPVLAETGAGERLLAVLRDVLPGAARIAADPAIHTVELPGATLVEGWIVGTFGGRIRVWLLEGGVALGESDEALRALGRLFRIFPDTVAVALVDAQHSCLVVQPEDCAPNIEVPRGSLVARHYRRPLGPVDEALSVFLREVIPSWEPIHGMREGSTAVADVQGIAAERAARAIEEQAAAGARARKTNPKRKALTDLGEAEAAFIGALVADVNEGRTTAGDVDAALRRMATRR